MDISAADISKTEQLAPKLAGITAPQVREPITFDFGVNIFKQKLKVLSTKCTKDVKK